MTRRALIRRIVSCEPEVRTGRFHFAAVQAANRTSGKGTVKLPTGNHALTISGAGGDTQGDLDVTDYLDIRGVSADTSVVNVSGLGDRALQISSDIDVTLQSFSMINGSTSGNGGAVSNNLGNLSLLNMQLTNNHANGIGGAIYSSSGDLTIDSSTVALNTAVSNAGGVASISGTSLLIINSTISTNESDGNTGGLYVTGGGQIKHSTIVKNDTDGTGASGLRTDSPGTLQMHHTILAGNTGGPDVQGTLHSASSYNVVTGPASGLTDNHQGNDINASFAQIGLAQLGMYGGPTWTHALIPIVGGLAIDKGYPFLTTPDYDQRGSQREYGIVDIGAYEYDGSGWTVTYTGDNSNNLVTAKGTGIWRRNIHY